MKLSSPPKVIGLVVAFYVLLFSGCASYHVVRVDALNDPGKVDAAGRTYELTSLIEGVDEGDLMFRETARYVERALAARGYRRAAAGEGAALVVEAAASLSDPMAGSRTYADPVYGYSRGYSYYRRVPIRNESGQVTGYHTYHYYDPPRTEFIGTVTRSETVSEYEKRLELVASERGPEGEPGVQVWRLTVVIKDTSSDLRGYLPYLATAVAEYAGTATDKQIELRMKLDDERVSAFRIR